MMHMKRETIKMKGIDGKMITVEIGLPPGEFEDESKKKKKKDPFDENDEFDNFYKMINKKDDENVYEEYMD